MKTAMFVTMTGLIVAAFGVGGVENSITNGELVQATIVAAVGLAVMWAGTTMVRNA